MNIVYEQRLKDYMLQKNKRHIVVEVISSNSSDFEVTELAVRFVDDRQAAFYTEKKNYRSVPGEVGDVLLPRYRLEYSDTVTFRLKSVLFFHLPQQTGIRL